MVVAWWFPGPRGGVLRRSRVHLARTPNGRSLCGTLPLAEGARFSATDELAAHLSVAGWCLPCWGTANGRDGTVRGAAQERLVAAAVEIVARDGFAGLTIGKVAGAAGTGRTAVYHWFADLDELVAAVVDEVLAMIPLPDPADRTDGNSGRLQDLVLASYRVLTTYPGALRRLEGPPRPGTVRWVEALRREIAAGSVSQAPDRTRVALFVVLSLLVAATDPAGSGEVADRERLDRERLVRSITGRLAATLRSGGPPE